MLQLLDLIIPDEGADGRQWLSLWGDEAESGGFSVQACVGKSIEAALVS